MFKKIVKEPLVQFIVLGAILYISLASFSPSVLESDNPYHIEVTDSGLREYLQYQRKSFNVEKAEERLKQMPLEAKKALTKSFIRDEVLYLEALSLGLEDNDEIIRRRLIQKMEYLAQGFYNELPAVSEEELTAFFKGNKARYKIDSSMSFTHVFFKEKSLPAENPNDLLLKKLKSLNEKNVAFEDAGQHGERFIYNQNYIERTPEYIASHFDSKFQQVLFQLEASTSWQGPIKSEHGFHIVLIKDKTKERMPDLNEVAAIVLADAQQESLRNLKIKAINDLIAKYEIEYR